MQLPPPQVPWHQLQQLQENLQNILRFAQQQQQSLAPPGRPEQKTINQHAGQKRVRDEQRDQPFGLLSLGAQGMDDMVQHEAQRGHEDEARAKRLRTALALAPLEWLAQFLRKRPFQFKSLATLTQEKEREKAKYEMIHGKWPRLQLGHAENELVFGRDADTLRDFLPLLKECSTTLRILDIVDCPNALILPRVHAALLKSAWGDPRIEILTIEQAMPVGEGTLLNWLTPLQTCLRILVLNTPDVMDTSLVTRLAGQHENGPGMNWKVPLGLCLYINLHRELPKDELTALTRTWYNATAETSAGSPILIVHIFPHLSLTPAVRCRPQVSKGKETKQTAVQVNQCALEDLAVELQCGEDQRNPNLTGFYCRIRHSSKRKNFKLAWFTDKEAKSPFARKVAYGTKRFWDAREVIHVRIEYNQRLPAKLKLQVMNLLRTRKAKVEEKGRIPMEEGINLQRVCYLALFFSRLADQPSLHQFVSLSEAQFLQGLPYTSLCRLLQMLIDRRLVSRTDTLLTLFAGGQLEGISCEGLVEYYERIGFRVTVGDGTKVPTCRYRLVCLDPGSLCLPARAQGRSSDQGVIRFAVTKTSPAYRAQVKDVHIDMHAFVDDVMVACAAREHEHRTKHWDALVRRQLIRGPTEVDPIARPVGLNEPKPILLPLPQLVDALTDVKQVTKTVKDAASAYEWVRRIVSTFAFAACTHPLNTPDTDDIQELINTCSLARFVVGVSPRYTDIHGRPRGARAWIIDRTLDPPSLETFTLPGVQTSDALDPLAGIKTSRRDPVYFKWPQFPSNVTDETEAKLAAFYIHLRLLRPDADVLLGLVNVPEWEMVQDLLTRYPAPLDVARQRVATLYHTVAEKKKETKEIKVTQPRAPNQQAQGIWWPELAEHPDDVHDNWFDDAAGAHYWLFFLSNSWGRLLSLDVPGAVPTDVQTLLGLVRESSANRFIAYIDAGPIAWVLDRKKQKIEVFDPLESSPEDWLLSDLRKMGKFRIEVADLDGVDDLVFDGMLQQQDARACAVFVHLRILNPEAKLQEIVAALFEGTVQQVLDRLDRYPAALPTGEVGRTLPAAPSAREVEQSEAEESSFE